MTVPRMVSGGRALTDAERRYAGRLVHKHARSLGELRDLLEHLGLSGVPFPAPTRSRLAEIRAVLAEGPLPSTPCQWVLLARDLLAALDACTDMSTAPRAGATLRERS